MDLNDVHSRKHYFFSFSIFTFMNVTRKIRDIWQTAIALDTKLSLNLCYPLNATRVTFQQMCGISWEMV